MASNHKVYTFSEVAKHNNKKDCWLIISGKVYDVTPFLDEHPGGDEVLLLATQKDGTTDFRSVGHSESAKELMETYCMGKVDTSTLPVKQQYNPPPPAQEFQSVKPLGLGTKLFQLLLPLLLLGVAFAMPFFGKKE